MTNATHLHKRPDTPHDRIWSKQKRDWPQFAEYERKTARDIIPVVVLERI